MRAYYLVFIVTLLCQLIPVKDDKSYKVRLFFTFLPLFLFGALRVDFGLDYAEYELDFYWAHHGSVFDVSEQSEYGYTLLTKIIPSWRLFLIITSAFICLAYGTLFYRCITPQKSWLAICLLFITGNFSIFFMFSGIRNAIAIAIMILAFPLIRDRKIIPYLGLTILALSFHTSAVFFMPLAYFLGFNKPMSKKEAKSWIITMFVLQIIPLDWLIQRVVPFVNLYFDRYNTYARTAAELGDTRSLLVRFTIIVFTMVIVRFMRATDLNKNENSICRLALLFSMCGLLGSLNMRMIQCYIMFFVCGNTVLISKWKEKDLRLVYTAFLFLYFGYSFFKVFMGSPYFTYRTYHSVFGSI